MMYIIHESEEQKRARTNRENARSRHCRIGAVKVKPPILWGISPSYPGIPSRYPPMYQPSYPNTHPYPSPINDHTRTGYWWQNPVVSTC